jgi:hypothetical protein
VQYEFAAMIMSPVEYLKYQYLEADKAVRDENLLAGAYFVGDIVYKLERSKREEKFQPEARATTSLLASEFGFAVDSGPVPAAGKTHPLRLADVSVVTSRSLWRLQTVVTVLSWQLASQGARPVPRSLWRRKPPKRKPCRGASATWQKRRQRH